MNKEKDKNLSNAMPTTNSEPGEEVYVFAVIGPSF
jgi:hypothetical protein